LSIRQPQKQEGTKRGIKEAKKTTDEEKKRDGGKKGGIWTCSLKRRYAHHVKFLPFPGGKSTRANSPGKSVRNQGRNEERATEAWKRRFHRVKKEGGDQSYSTEGKEEKNRDGRGLCRGGGGRVAQ